MQHRIDALVHAGQTSTEVADELGISVEDYVAHGNGYAVVMCQYPVPEPKPKRKATKKATKAPESDVEAPSADAEAEKA